jgi:phosphopantothenoylcysteine decarboxylase/phosphopantothenate--cysteine ligase
MKIFDECEIVVMAAAVADYRPAVRAEQKIKKKEDTMSLDLTKNIDILKSLGSRKKKNQVLVGFALETANEEYSAIEKLEKKNADLIILNSLNDAGAGFGHDTNKITIYSKKNEPIHFDLKSKTEVAKDIVDTIIKSFYA